MAQSLYSRLIAAGIPCSNWQSDLYFPVTDESRAIVAQCLADGAIKTRPGVFRSNIDGRATFDAPFQFDPYWQAREGI